MPTKKKTPAKKAPPFMKKGEAKGKACPHCGAPMKKSGAKMKCTKCGRSY